MTPPADIQTHARPDWRTFRPEDYRRNPHGKRYQKAQEAHRQELAEWESKGQMQMF